MPEPLYVGPLTIARRKVTRDLGRCTISQRYPDMWKDLVATVPVIVTRTNGGSFSLLVPKVAISVLPFSIATPDGTPFNYWEKRLALPCGAMWRGEYVMLTAVQEAI